MAEPTRRTVLVTRPEPGLSETRVALERLGWEPHLAPMLRISTLPMRPARHIDRVVVTSGQSLETLRQAVSSETPLTAVGARTAERARSLGFVNVDHAEGDAQSLIRHLGQPTRYTSLLLATGRGLGTMLADDLRRQGWRVTRRVVYRTEPADALDDETRSLLQERRIAAILFYSSATARSFLAALGTDHSALLPIRALALSSRIADALRVAPFADIAVARRPDQRALLDLLGPLPATLPEPPRRDVVR